MIRRDNISAGELRKFVMSGLVDQHDFLQHSCKLVGILYRSCVFFFAALVFESMFGIVSISATHKA